jgi:hypothetical protein
MDDPVGWVEFADSDELERLRRRAYGPDADIVGDVAAQARLSELEAAQRRQLTPVVDAAAAISARVSERVPVPEPVGGPLSASTSALILIAAGAWGSQLLANGSAPIPAETSTVKVPPVPDGFGPGITCPHRTMCSH